MVELPALGPTLLHVPRTPATGVVVLLHDADAGPVLPVLDALAASSLVVQVNADAWAVPGGASCRALADVLVTAARRSQREAGFTSYLRPVIAAHGRAAGFARDLVLATDPQVLPRGVGRASTTAVGPSRCVVEPTTWSPTDASGGSRWSPVTVTSSLSAEVVTAMEEAAAVRPMTSSALDRWLSNFQLPLTALWADQPRAVLVLMSDEGGLVTADATLARELVESGVSVVSIDALRYFWQRRSPRDVAFEIRRLAGALASTGLPVMVGGVGFGAETMAVTARMVEGQELAALVLIEPGPTAFFEVEPPAPAQLTLIRPDWSTPAAVTRAALPTLCASGASGRDQYLCRTLEGSGHAVTGVVPRAEEPGRDQAIAALVADFVEAHVPMKIPRPPAFAH
jgi:type IV secretory pathway VirJ component